MKKFIAFMAILALLVSCKSGDKGELVGVQGGGNPEKPYGMTLVPGAFIMGKSDVASIQDAQLKQ
jgi:hypothetical protein